MQEIETAEARQQFLRQVLADLDALELLLRRDTPEGRRQFTVIHRHAVGPQDGFRMRPGFVNFQPVEKDQPLADDRGGMIRAMDRAAS